MLSVLVYIFTTQIHKETLTRWEWEVSSQERIDLISRWTLPGLLSHTYLVLSVAKKKTSSGASEQLAELYFRGPARICEPFLLPRPLTWWFTDTQFCQTTNRKDR